MKDEDVAQYLRDNPQFFNDNSDQLLDIHIPHPHEDKVISLTERQLLALRDENRILQSKLLELISFGEENDVISEKIHRLSIALISTSNVTELLQTMNYSLREDFAVPYIALRLWNMACVNKAEQDLVEFTETSADSHAIAEGLAQPYCGTHLADDVEKWFGDDASKLNSFAMIPIYSTQSIGLLVLGTPEETRFYPEMGTLHLKRLGELISTSLTRYDMTVINAAAKAPSEN